MVSEATRIAILVIIALATLPALYAIIRAIAYAWHGRHLRRAVRAGMRKRAHDQ